MSTLIKRTFHTALAKSVLREINTNGSRYYFFLTKPSSSDFDNVPVDDFSYELQTRNDIVLMRNISPTDVCMVTKRIDWTSGTVYDFYDDLVSTKLIGINVTNGGYGYATTPDVVISSVDGHGSGATAVCDMDSQGRVLSVRLTNAGSGYTVAPIVQFKNSVLAQNGYDAVASAVISVTHSGATTLEDSKFYVLTDDFNVYKCIDNNKSSASTVKPTSTSYEPFYTSDGYLWKYLYTIPVSIRNKFITPDYIPVINALSDFFYSSGSLTANTVVSGGTGYSWATIEVHGDGYSKENPFILNSCYITNPGDGYDSADIIFEPPFSSNYTWLEGSSATYGDIVEYQDKFYRVDVSGEFGATAPYHVQGTYTNGSTVLTYIGESAKAILNVENQKVKTVDLIGRLLYAKIDVGGYGYTKTPEIKIVGATYTERATTIAKMQNGSIVDIVTINSGMDYIGIPVVVVGKQWEPYQVLEAGEQIFYGNYLYTVNQSGITGDQYPSHKFGTATNGTCILAYAGLAAKATAVMAYGYGYKQLPEYSITPSDKGCELSFSGTSSSAKLLPVIDDGSIVDVVMKDAGVGYTYANATVYGDGKGAIVNPNVYFGSLDNNQGNSELFAVAGGIHKIQLISQGYGYNVSTTLPTVRIIGDGTGATAVVIMDRTNNLGNLSYIKITNPGKGYNYASVVIEGGSGFGASARAIISPYLGHGKDSITELFSTKLMLHTEFRNESFLNFNLSTNYRQIGVIRNPRRLSDKSYISGDIHTPCLIVSGTFDGDVFSENMIIKSATSQKTLKIVSMTTNGMILQSLQNYIPEVNEILDNNLTGLDYSRFFIQSIITPSIDKYSGDVLYIENRDSFKPTDAENITIRTVLSF